MEMSNSKEEPEAGFIVPDPSRSVRTFPATPAMKLT
jgi:hypothetical protein